MKKVIALVMSLMLVVSCMISIAMADGERLKFEATLLPMLFDTSGEIMESATSRTAAAATAFLECLLKIHTSGEYDLSGLQEDCYIARQNSTIVFAFSMKDGDEILFAIYNSLTDEYEAEIFECSIDLASSVIESIGVSPVYTIDQEDMWDAFEILLNELKDSV